MTKLAYLMAGLSLSLLAACSSEDTQLSQQPALPSAATVTVLSPEAQPAVLEPSADIDPSLQTELVTLQQRLQTLEAALAQAQTELSESAGQLQALTAEQQQWSAQQASLDENAEQIQQLEQQLSQQAHALNQAQMSLIQAETECQQAAWVKPDPKQVAGLDPKQVER
ncbi:hypothetical protein SAMN02745130_00261 [Thiothrix eikelboomii]|uniref:Uncharacterized protein n=1 Tax=Thiothrix eikelboomii TaxID=92487 RepID=A0A1T4VTJ4_9GAMM|nr:hypothetical protein [Thiothrix eikelboomii]SKA68320.1 hypothetical protein SAMN02745130_00261 [Thiothrix eikelboomii]